LQHHPPESHGILWFVPAGEVEEESGIRPDAQDSGLGGLEDRHHPWPDLSSHVLETHAPAPLGLELTTDAEVNLVTYLKGVDVNTMIDHVADHALGVICDGVRLPVGRQNLPADWGRLLLLIGPLLAQEDDEIGLQACPLCTECGARGVVPPC
jgi:hypothetical protein